YRTPRERSREVAVQDQDIPVAWLEVEPPPVVHVTAMPLDAAEAIVDKVRRVSPRARITLDTHEDYVVDYRKGLRALACRGDAFCGGFAAGLSLGYGPVEAAQRGTISASYALAGFSSIYLTHVEPSEAQARIISDPPIARDLSLPTPLAQVEVPGTDRGISSSADIMREEIATIPRLLEEQHEILAKPLSILARGLHDANIEHFYLVGCGDSAFAGAATALAFQKHAGIRAEGIHALEMARYRVRYLPQYSSVVCISFSGRVGRTIEAAKQARRFGHRVLALTGNLDSPLAKEAPDIITR